MYKTIKIGTAKSPVIAVGVTEGADRLPAGTGDLAAPVREELSAALKRRGFKGSTGQVAAAGDRAVLVGLGAKDSMTAATVRTIGARLVKAMDRMGHTTLKPMLLDAVHDNAVKQDEAATALIEGIVLANWRVDFFDGAAANTEQNGKPPAKASLTIIPPDSARKQPMQRGVTLADATNYARRLAATPPNICNPTWMTAQARQLARDFGMSVRVIDYKRAMEQGMGGLTAVGRGSATKPCLIILEHKPTKPRKGVKIALVGKTITYDTGGYSLKINNTMKGMKYDKCGGMAVIGAMRAIADLNLPVHVVGLLPAAENMVNADAYRPDDIITMYNDVTVEVTNTDAEGRLVLADALAYACKKIKPTAVIDAATLTGGVVVGLGHFCAGYWCDDDALRQRIEHAADATGEKVWRLPLWKDHREFMRAKHADIWNSAPSRNAHPIQGAAFLSYFVDKDLPWAHIDIAGVADVESDKDLYVTGPTGYGVRLLTSIVQQHA